jgi:DNA-binding NarL/FixJ family response regulator
MLLKPLNLAIVDESMLFRKLLRSNFSEQDKLNVVIDTSELYDLLQKPKDYPVDILIIDVLLRKHNIRDSLKQIYQEHPNIRILILSMCTDIEVISDLLNLGVYGYVSKTDSPEELMKAVVSICEGKIYRNRFFTELLYLGIQRDAGQVRHGEKLKLRDREVKILQLLWEEKSNKEIADLIHLSLRSIEKIKQDLKDKIGAKSTVGLLKYAVENKIIYAASKSHYYQL